MKTISNIEFPETQTEADGWKPTIRICALHTNVLVVASTRIEGAWKAYCKPVYGMKHDDEKFNVLYDGCPMAKKIALAMFPMWKEIPYAN